MFLTCCEQLRGVDTYRRASPLGSAGSRVLSPSVSGSYRQHSAVFWRVCQAGGSPGGPPTSAGTSYLPPQSQVLAHRQEGNNNCSQDEILKNKTWFMIESNSPKDHLYLWGSGHDGAAAPPAGLRPLYTQLKSCIEKYYPT